MNRANAVSVAPVPKGGGWMNVLLILGIVMLAVILLMTGYYLVTACSGSKKSFATYMTDLQFSPCYGGTPAGEEAEAEVDYAKRALEREPEVFHISDQVYTYEQAKCKCNSYGAELATRDQVVNAYNQGANWCSYGWSAGGQAFYPTQPSAFYERLAKHPRDWYVCGNKPGVMGGPFPKSVRFGVNCYGVKPDGVLSVPKPTPPPTEAQICAIEGDYKSNHQLKSDQIAPFNQSTWSVYG